MSLPEPATRVMLVDDQPLFRRAIATLIGEQADFVVVGEASNGQEAIERARELRPDLIVMDVEMPVMNGVEAVRFIRDELPEVRIVVLTVSEEEDYLFDAVRFGAHGYLLKDLQPDQLYEMLRAVRRGETPISPMMAGRLLAEFRRWSPGPEAAAEAAPANGSRDGYLPAQSRVPAVRNHLPPVQRFISSPRPAAESLDPTHLAMTSAAAGVLTRREMETLQYVADGLSNKEIGSILSITEGTVKNHVHNALEKLQLENRIQAAAYVVREGFAHRPDAR